MTRLFLLLTVIVLLAVTPAVPIAQAQTAPDTLAQAPAAAAAQPAKLQRLAVRSFTAKDVSADTAAVLTDLACNFLSAANRFEVMCASDIAAMVKTTEKQALMGVCDNESCYAKLGELLESPYLLNGLIGHVGDRYVLTLSLIDTGEKRAVARINHTVKDDKDNLIPGIEVAVKKLLAELPQKKDTL